jgi:hypothetical protein
MSETNSERKTIRIKERKGEFCFSISLKIEHIYVCLCYIGRGSRGQFHFDFPNELIGIIRPDDFQQSIDNMNRARRLTLSEKRLKFSLYLNIVVGLILFLVGLVTIATLISALWISLLSVGIVMYLSSCCILILLFIRMNRSSEARLKNAVDEESMKYSTKLSVPNVWRLDKVVTPSDDGESINVTYFISNIISTSHILLKPSLSITELLRRKWFYT